MRCVVQISLQQTAAVIIIGFIPFGYIRCGYNLRHHVQTFHQYRMEVTLQYRFTAGGGTRSGRGVSPTQYYFRRSGVARILDQKQHRSRNGELPKSWNSNNSLLTNYNSSTIGRPNPRGSFATQYVGIDFRFLVPKLGLNYN